MTLNRREGYTLIEVMMAIGVMTVGAVGIMSLQQASTVGNMEAREMTVASQAAQTWLERLKRDSLLWTVAGLGNLGATRYLNQVAAPTTAPQWILPAPADVTESFGFNYLGQETRTAANIRYCTQVRLQWVFPGQAMRADVRVFWPRRGGGNALAAYPGCVGAAAAITNDARLRFVYASTVLRWVSRP